jgi:D-alanyl-D-alanine carboxypeptidase
MLSTYEKGLISIVIILATFASFFFYNEQWIERKILSQDKFEERARENLKSRVESLPLQAKAISIYDIDTGKELYGKNQYEKLPLASLAKTMTVIIALEKHPPGQKIKISTDAINQDGDNGLLLGEIWNLEDLAKFTLVSSSNDGALALSEGIGGVIGIMNEKAKKIGMENTTFYNPTGLDFGTTSAGAYGSAYDANKMVAFALSFRPDIFGATTESEEVFSSPSLHRIENTNILTEQANGFLFSKTGFTVLAGGNLTVIYLAPNSHKIAITVLSSTFNGRFSDMEKLINIL